MSATIMRIAIIGSGNVGSVLGRRLAAVGHEVCFASRQPQGQRVRSLVAENPHACIASDIATAVRTSELVIFAAPYDSARATLTAIDDFHGAVLVDCSNPLNATFDGLKTSGDESAAQRIARWAPTARVVKAFNTSSVATMADPRYDGHAAAGFYCGDCEQAKAVVAELIGQLGMEPVDAGPLSNARYLEATAMLYIHLAVRGGWGGNCALKVLRR